MRSSTAVARMSLRAEVPSPISRRLRWSSRIPTALTAGGDPLGGKAIDPRAGAPEATELPEPPQQIN
jgi:hypothetical protein